MTNENDGTFVRASDFLTDLGRALAAPMKELLDEVHRLDREHADDDGMAELVELAYKVHGIVEPLTAVAEFERHERHGARRDIDFASVLGRARAPGVQMEVRGTLGTSFDDPAVIEKGLTLFLSLLTGTEGAPTRVRAAREVHASGDRIVLTLRFGSAGAPDRVRFELAHRVALALGARLERQDGWLTLELEARAETTGPAAPILAFEHQQGSTETSSESPPVVVVVDHDPAVRDYMTRILEFEGYLVTPLGDIGAARDAARLRPPDVIVMDPLDLVRDGAAGIGPLKDDEVLGAVPRVLLRNPEAGEILGPIDAADVVDKPIDPARLLEAVGRQTGIGHPPALLLVRAEEDRALWERYLNGQGFRLVATSDVREAHRILDTMVPAGVVVDLARVPEGAELIEAPRLRQNGVPVIVVSGRLSKKERLRIESLASVRIPRSALKRASLLTALRKNLGEEALRAASAGNAGT